uniref:C2H2-type domain-containing protein n=1 Tax=Stegastes partitus TaxID=144197 RepID=A0A3B4ZKI6_9TELE
DLHLHACLCVKRFCQSNFMARFSPSRTVGRNSPTQVISRGTCVFTRERNRSAAETATRLSPTPQLVKPTRKPTALSGFNSNSLTPSPLKPYCCSTCGKSYRQISLLNLHRKRHTGEARYSCKVCGKLFTTSGNLKRHQLVHSGEKPYHCDYCEKAFSDPTAKISRLFLRKHNQSSSTDTCRSTSSSTQVRTKPESFNCEALNSETDTELLSRRVCVDTSSASSRTHNLHL